MTVAGVALLLAVVLLSRFRPPPVDGDRAYGYLQEAVSFGPRPPGSEAHRQMADWLVAQLEPLADDVTRQTVAAPVSDDTLFGTNIVASFNLQPERNKRIMLSAHWDTRPWADNDPDTTAHDEPILGANDGGSGVAVLLAVAEVLHAHPPEIGVDLLFFDLEDSGRDSTVGYALGSEFFAETNAQYRPTFGINVDMVCDPELEIPMEANSYRSARWVVDLIWEAAADAGAEMFVDRTAPAVFDDHVPFLQRGIPVVDLIPVPFPPYWHTLDDTIEHCSPGALAQVGEVLVRVLYSQ